MCLRQTHCLDQSDDTGRTVFPVAVQRPPRPSLRLQPFHRRGPRLRPRCAALELAEQGNRIADAAGGVTDDAWESATRHYDENQLSDLVMFIALANATSRTGVTVRRGAADDYEPSTFADTAN